MTDTLRLLFIDIETTPATVLVWDSKPQFISVEQIVQPTRLLCFTAKWRGEDGFIFRGSARASGREYTGMVREIHKLLTAADAVCHYNGERFDIPRLNQEFLQLNLAPPPPIPQVDLWKVNARKFDFFSKKLAFIGPTLGIGAKVEHEGWPLWRKCMDGDTAAWARMKEYNQQDVALLEGLYEKLLPWIERHPNMNHYVDSEHPVCPRCGSEKIQRRGVQINVTLTYRRYQCLACRHWFQARFAEKVVPRVEVK